MTALSMKAIRQRLLSSIRCWRLTRYPAGRFVPPAAVYRFNGARRLLRGQHLLSMMMNIIVEDEYRLRQCVDIITVADIGANAGVFAIHAATLFPHATVHCYEPDPRSIADLHHNVRGLNVAVYPEAVTRASGRAEFAMTANLTSSHLVTEGGLASTEVATVDLNEVANRLGSPSISFLKLDCEGSEYEILTQPALQRFDRVAGELHVTERCKPMDALDALRRQRFEILEFRSFPCGKAVFVAVREN